MICGPLIQMIGFNYQTIERNAESFTVFLCFFVNSCIMPILLSSNFSVDYPDTFFDSVFSMGGRSGDFDSNWYRDTSSQLTSAIIVLTLQPFLHFSAEYVILKVNRSLKLKYIYAKHDNNKLDNIKFLEMNAGPEYPF